MIDEEKRENPEEKKRGFEEAAFVFCGLTTNSHTGGVSHTEHPRSDDVEEGHSAGAPIRDKASGEIIYILGKKIDFFAEQILRCDFPTYVTACHRTSLSSTTSDPAHHQDDHCC